MISDLNRILLRKRFLDDMFFLWVGTVADFTEFKEMLNVLGSKMTFTLKGDVANTVDFLDVRVSNVKGGLETTIFVKPTDSTRYLHRRSDHSAHMFTAIPYSQFRRAVVICSETSERDKCMDYMKKKFLDSGYHESELEAARERALRLNRLEILLPEPRSTLDSSQAMEILTFVINHDPAMAIHV